MANFLARWYNGGACALKECLKGRIEKSACKKSVAGMVKVDEYMRVGCGREKRAGSKWKCSFLNRHFEIQWVGLDNGRPFCYCIISKHKSIHFHQQEASII